MLPLRIQVFGTHEVRKEKNIIKQGFGFDLWNPEQQCGQEARLPSAGSYLWPGLHATRRAALIALAQPGIEQVSIRTNQDKQVARLYRYRLEEYLCVKNSESSAQTVAASSVLTTAVKCPAV
jgi:hypothetical protein